MKINENFIMDDYIVEMAKPSEIDVILNVYKERIDWFKKNEIIMWNKYLEHHPKEEFLKAILNQTFFVVKKDDEIIACFELTDENRFWSKNDSRAYYVYKIVTKPGNKGIANIIFDFCKETAILNNKNYLRIDHVKRNEKLNNIYENHGFKIIDSGQVDYYEFNLRQLSIK